MLEIKDIEKLSQLARIDLSAEEKKSYVKEIGAILNYVDQIKSAVAKTGEERKMPDLRNITRNDEYANESGHNTEAIVAEFPRKDSNYLKVKKIIEQ